MSNESATRSRVVSRASEPYPARSTVGVCDLLGGATVMIDAVVAIE
ncbi:hypothetical protein [Natrinema versiforme]|uniref:Uncharacterized protein n=1 Tax=Natrinema versiforme JCM 10478 TaxID=1227496 RepID=L9XUJ3_9EURY|nr:hypothetical protein [Natrinema versiforme]ELY65479.1 hypothetical protein C489_14415 [Natrinema versiforme JCM 10478]